MQLKIKVTKDILRQAMWCGVEGKCHKAVTESCAFAVALQELVPRTQVTLDAIIWGGIHSWPFIKTEITGRMYEFILAFDSAKPYKRLDLPEQEFTIDFPDSLVERIGIGEVDRVLKVSKTLERI